MKDTYDNFDTGLLQPRLIVRRLACAHHELDIVCFKILHARTELVGYVMRLTVLTLMQRPMDWLSGALMMRKW